MNKNHYTLLYIFLMASILFLHSCNEKVVQVIPEQQFAEIKKVLYAQQEAWNDGDIEKFMEGYWNNEAMSFVGKSGVKYGWTTTLNNYKKGYPDVDAMGKLNFDVIELRPLSHDVYYMLGQYTLTRKEDKPTGYFSLIWQKIDGQWLITSDHTSG